MKNCDPFVSLPLLAMDSRYCLLCLTAKLSSGGKGEDCTAILKPTSVWITTDSSDGGLFTFKKASIDGFSSFSISYVREKRKHEKGGYSRKEMYGGIKHLMAGSQRLVRLM